MSITKIVITGGPCAGKSTAMSRIQKELTQLGYKVYFIAESATELITSGITPDLKNFQKHLLQYQLDKEKVYENIAKDNKAKTVIILDRGVLDSKIYMQPGEFKRICKALNTSELELRDHYDAVFHLVTAAKGAAEFYTTANNAARRETVEEAAYMDDRGIEAWTGHPHFRVIDNSTNFEDKIKRLMKEITSFLGEPEPFEIERKFLIKKPSLKWLDSLPNVEKVEIIQTYLKSTNPNEEVRVRQRGLNGKYIYTKTTKRIVSDVKRVEVEKRLSQAEYINYLMDADTNKHQIRKTRYCMTYDNCYLEIDIYPGWKNEAILEIELSSEDAKISIPDKIKIIKEVTDDESYKNVNLANN